MLRSEADAYRFLEQLRWDGAPTECPLCGTAGRVYYLRPADGRSRATRTGARSLRRVWKCGACRKQFSVLTGTVLQGTRAGVLTWVAVIARVVDGPVSARELAETFAITPETARHMLGRLARAAPTDPLLGCLARRKPAVSPAARPRVR